MLAASALSPSGRPGYTCPVEHLVSQRVEVGEFGVMGHDDQQFGQGTRVGAGVQGRLHGRHFDDAASAAIGPAASGEAGTGRDKDTTRPARASLYVARNTVKTHVRSPQ